MKSNRSILSLIVSGCVVTACACGGVALAGNGTVYAPTNTDGIDIEAAIASAQPDDPYVCDEVCLSCHGGSYAALAETTDAYGDSNPHAGTHGWGGASCNYCHVQGGEVPTPENNKCLDCHDWPRPEQTLIKYLDK